MRRSWCHALVHLNPYSGRAISFAVDLVNERPTTVEQLVERCAAAGVHTDYRLAPNDVADTHALLDAWEEVVDAPDADSRARLLNEMLAAASAYPRLTDHAGEGWHLHYRDSTQSLSQVLAALIAVRTALHLTDRGMDRLGRCTLAECRRVYADTSRTGRQRYCSPTCANRDAVRRHRARAGQS
jgi:hypothetical protein